MKRRLLLVATMVLTLVPALVLSDAHRAAAAPAYTITDLGTLYGFGWSTADGINAAGQVVGTSYGQGDWHRSFVFRDGTMADLLGPMSHVPTYSSADAINDHGDIVGTLEANSGSHAFLSSGGKWRDLGTLPGGASSDASAINAGGQIVGSSTTASGATHAVRWQDGMLTDLGVPAGFDTSGASGVNAAGTIVGVVGSGPIGPTYRTRAFVYRDDTFTVLGPVPGGGSSAASAINDRGQVVGGADDELLAGHAFLWQDGHMTDLGTIPGEDSSSAAAINNLGQVVGGTGHIHHVGRAFLWQNGVMTDLNNLIPADSGWVLDWALAINDAGQIVGDGEHNGQSRAFLLTPTTPPPPAKQCFPQTGKCVQGRFLAYWEQHGGLAVNGYPLSDEFTQTLEDGKPYTVQYFERVRLEYHPENASPYDVELGQFGRRILAGVPNAPTSPASPKDGDTFFQQTQHNVSPQFMAYWNANGGLAQFGYPLTEPFPQQLEDGKTYTVQYFERARFEAHPENPSPYDVELGQFGRRILAESGH